MLTAETQEKYLKILRKGNTLKVEPSDAIELVEKFEDLEKVDQIGRSSRCEAFKESLTSCKEKIIMKFISIINTNANTNTLNLNINSPITIKDLFEKDEVKAFAPEATIESIASYDGYDQASMEVVNMETLSVTDDTVIEIAAFGEFKPQTVAAPQQGRVTILAGGGSLSKSVTY